jgi:ATP-dependent DNA helicase RecG
MQVRLDTPVQFVKGVGPKRAEIFGKVNIRTAEDLLHYRPFRYEDRTNFQKIAKLTPGAEVVVQGSVVAAGGYSTRRKGVQIFETLIGDRTGTISAKFFNQPYLSTVLEKGQRVIIFGHCRPDPYSGGLSFVNPEFEILLEDDDFTIHTGRIVPVYRRVGPISARILRRIILNLLNNLGADLQDTLPQRVREKYGLPGRLDALRSVHFPEVPSGTDRARFLASLMEGRTPFQQRLIFEEFFLFQLGLQLVRAKRRVLPKVRKLEISDRVRQRIKEVLPFRPTGAQKRVLKEIVEDLLDQSVMSRLLQGDVGSGKTIVALQAMLVVVENGYQAVLMVPTELLAEQHFRNLSRYLATTPYKLAFLSSSVKGKKKEQVLAQIQSGEAQFIIGTHALIEAPVEFRTLGLAVIDEQHRFGVVQRSLLMGKGHRPDILVMTATPIPRSLALTVYGDLDVSILDELPPGRQPVRTVVKAEKNRAEVYSVIEKELRAGRQAYVVYPLIEESEKVDLRAATEMASHLEEEVFSEFRVGLMHGRLKSDEKDRLMARFLAGEIQILVSTTVIEVGIDVPNATLMIIEHAERFGLSQLHQLRGRIGRGEHRGLCVLMVESVRTREAYERLSIMRETSDGFRIAEKDLEIRGPGEFVGTRQSGLPEFRFGNIVRDRKWLELARQEAEKHILEAIDPKGAAGQEEIEAIRTLWQKRFGLFEVG